MQTLGQTIQQAFIEAIEKDTLATPTSYNIMCRTTGQRVATCKSLKRAQRAVDTRDNAYGKYNHYIQRVYNRPPIHV